MNKALLKLNIIQTATSHPLQNRHIDHVIRMSEKVPYLSAGLYQHVFCVVSQNPQCIFGHSLSH